MATLSTPKYKPKGLRNLAQPLKTNILWILPQFLKQTPIPHMLTGTYLVD